MAEQQKTDAEAQDVETGEGAAEESAPIIPGTTWKTPEEAAKGLQEMKALVDRQGNELGMTRKQLADYQKMIESSSKPNQPEKPAGPDYDAELAKIDQQIEKLDVDDANYSKDLSKLNRQARNLEAQRVKAETAETLMKQFEQTLNERDSQQNQQSWVKENPDFQTPEMQQAIQEYMAQPHKVDMDPVLAYREIQNQQMAERLKQMAAENEDFRKRLKLKQGETEVGKVTTKGGGLPASKPTQKATGAALDEGMKEAFRNAS